MTKNNILKMDYNQKKKKDSFAYLMWSILKKKEEGGKRRGRLSGYNLNIIDGFLNRN